MTTVRILVDDPFERFSAGEIGKVLGNDSSKYDYFVDLGDIEIKTHIETFGPLFNQCIAGQKMARKFYFYAHELEVLK